MGAIARRAWQARDDSAEPRRRHAAFEYSRAAVMIADDERRLTDANAAACELLKISRDRLLTKTIDELTPPHIRDEVPALWESFLSDGARAGVYEFFVRDSEPIQCQYGAVANVTPGRHLCVVLPVEEGNEPSRLTTRESEVLELLALGHTTREISEALGIAPETAKTHIGNTLEKLGARNRAHAVALALRKEQL